MFNIILMIGLRPLSVSRLARSVSTKSGLMVSKDRPLKRQSTALATGADQVTTDIDQIADNSDLIDTDKWKVVSDGSMARLIANTIHNRCCCKGRKK